MNKDWVIPDVHGCHKTLKALVENLLKVDSGDRLFFLGDYLDRGPNSKSVIDYIWQLEKQGVQLVCLRGNHEDYCIKSFYSEQNRKSFFGIKSKNQEFLDWQKHGAQETMKSFQIQSMKTFPEPYLQWMEGLKYYHKLDEFILVHAGFNFKIEDIFEDEHAMMWIRDFRADLNKTGQRKVIHGHVPISMEFLELQLKNPSNYSFIALDNGVYMTRKEGFGNLVALELNTMDLKVQRNLDIF